MPVSRKKNFTTFQGYAKKIIKDIENKDIQLRMKAARHVAKKAKEKLGKRAVSQPGEPPGKHSGNLIKGIKAKHGSKYLTYVGAVAPAYHAVLLELGTRKMAKRPWLFTTFMEQRAEIIHILSEVRF